ncbi:hypothetical protein N7492_009233 [Penicillium capsulatum]|uniref:Uncharacterized protein n=1 Tax=Penicillium capsulatum TaxID=69766 RepID=A0A9W9LI21_9EURO|nr:hypothetical protein N7492_009233 [Penicillium capsulatum]
MARTIFQNRLAEDHMDHTQIAEGQDENASEIDVAGTGAHLYSGISEYGTQLTCREYGRHHKEKEDELVTEIPGGSHDE